MSEATYAMLRMLTRLLSSTPTILILVGMIIGAFFLGRFMAERHLLKHHLDDIAEAENSKLELEVHDLKLQVASLTEYRMQVLHIKGILK